MKPVNMANAITDGKSLPHAPRGLNLIQLDGKMKKTLFLCLSVFATGLMANAMPAPQKSASSPDFSLLNKVDLPRTPQLASESLVIMPAVTFSAAEPLVILPSNPPNPFITPEKDKDGQVSVPESGATITFLATSLAGLAGLRRFRRN
jgi:hypothetical protein